VDTAVQLSFCFVVSAVERAMAVWLEMELVLTLVAKFQCSFDQKDIEDLTKCSSFAELFVDSEESVVIAVGSVAVDIHGIVVGNMLQKVHYDAAPRTAPDAAVNLLDHLLAGPLLDVVVQQSVAVGTVEDCSQDTVEIDYIQHTVVAVAVLGTKDLTCPFVAVTLMATVDPC
jgi:hypothetical protein